MRNEASSFFCTCSNVVEIELVDVIVVVAALLLVVVDTLITLLLIIVCTQLKICNTISKHWLSELECIA